MEVTIAVVRIYQRELSVRARVGPEYTEIWFGGVLNVVISNAALAAWIDTPTSVFRTDSSVTFHHLGNGEFGFSCDGEYAVANLAVLRQAVRAHHRSRP